MKRKNTYLFVLLMIGLLGCRQGTTAVISAPTTPEVAAITSVVPTPTVFPSATATSFATPTPLPPTSTATETAVPTDTPTPSVTPTPLHPMMIEVMRQQSYPGSALTVVEMLEPGVNFDRTIVSYESEGNTIFALLTVPWGDTPETGWPVVIFNHGYIPPDQYRTTERYVNYVHGFASQGYIVFRSDYRGHGKSEGEPESAYRSPAYTADVLNGLAAVKTLPEADPDRIGMWGHSMGGFITLRAMVVSGEIKAGVIWGGVVVSYEDLFAQWRRGDQNALTPTSTPRPNSIRSRWFDLYGTPEENPAFWASISANSYVADLSGPIQLHHGTADQSVPFIFSEILHDEIQAAGIPSELHIYEGDNHNISNSFWTAMERSVAFFDQYVKQAP